MGEGDHKVALLLGLQVLGPLVDHLGVLIARDHVGDLLRDKYGDVRHKAYDADPHSGLLQNGVRLDILRQRHFREIIVGADHRTLDLGKSARELIHTVVELMVAQSHAIVLHRVDQIDLDVASEHGEIGRALIEVAGMEEQHVPLSVSLHDTVAVGGALDHSAHTLMLA